MRHHRSVKKVFFTGLFVLIPLGVTYWLLQFLIRKTQRVARPLVENLLHFFAGENSSVVPEWVITFISVIVVLTAILLIGWLANFYLGRKFLSLMDTTMLKLPVVRNIYGGTKQIIDAFAMQRSPGSFKKVALLEYPRAGCWALGFVTNENVERSKEIFGREMAAVFLPSTPNPTTGFLLYLDPFDLYLVDLDVEEAVKLIVSAGLVLPPVDKKPPRTLGEVLKLSQEEKEGHPLMGETP